MTDVKQTLRHPIETVFSQITQRFPKSIPAVTLDGFLLKASTFVLVRTLEAAFIANLAISISIPIFSD